LAIFIPAIDAVIKETILAAIKARGAIFVKARFRVGAKTPSAANEIPIEPKLAKPIHNSTYQTKTKVFEIFTT
jgi:hypothetical protein